MQYSRNSIQCRLHSLEVDSFKLLIASRFLFSSFVQNVHDGKSFAPWGETESETKSDRIQKKKQNIVLYLKICALFYHLFRHRVATAVYQVTRPGHEHCDATEGILLDITPLVVDGKKLVTLYDKDLTEGVNLLIGMWFFPLLITAFCVPLWAAECLIMALSCMLSNHLQLIYVRLFFFY